MAKRKTRLSDIETVEVSLVRRGANNKKFYLLKSVEGEDVDEFLEKILKGELSDDDLALIEKAKMTPEEQAACKAALKILGKVKGKVPEELMAKLAEAAGFQYAKPGEKKPEMKQKVPPKDKYKYPMKKTGGEVEELEVDEDVKKAFEERDGEIAALKKSNEDLVKSLAEEKKIRKEKEFKEKAEGFGYRGDEATKVSKSLLAASEKMTEDEYKDFEEIVKSNAKRVENKNLFKEFGKGVGDDDNPRAKVEKSLDSAKAEIKKAHPEWSEAKLEDEALRQNPALYNEYLDANPAQGGY